MENKRKIIIVGTGNTSLTERFINSDKFQVIDMDWHKINTLADIKFDFTKVLPQSEVTITPSVQRTSKTDFFKISKYYNELYDKVDYSVDVKKVSTKPIPPAHILKRKKKK